MRKRLGFISVLVATLVFVLSCGDDDAASSPTSYEGPGSIWGATLNPNGTFTITQAPDVDSAVTLTVNGTYETLASGFLKLTVTSSEGTDGPTAGDQAYALNVPGMVLLVKPIGSESGEIIPMVATGTCPTEDLTLNWVQVNMEDGKSALSTTTDFFGTFTYDPATLATDLPNKWALEAFTAVTGGSGVPAAESCSNGRLQIGTTADGAIIWLTPSGAAIVTTLDAGESDGAIMAMTASELTQANLDGTYAGLAWSGNDNSNFPVSLTISSSGTAGVAKLFDDTDAIDNNTPSDTEAATLTFNDVNEVGATTANGMFTGTINGPDENIACMAIEDANSSGKNIIFCIGQDPGDPTKGFSVLGVQQ